MRCMFLRAWWRGPVVTIAVFAATGGCGAGSDGGAALVRTAWAGAATSATASPSPAERADSIAVEPAALRPAGLADDVIDPDAIRWSADARFLYGPVHGFAQVPSGGRDGTTSPGRPKFGELGLDDASAADVVARARRGRDELTLDAQFITTTGDATLEHDLVSRDQEFPAGTSVHGSLDLAILRADYGRRFTLEGDDGIAALTLTPFVGGGVFHSSYELSGGGGRATRSYTKPFPEVGLELAWHPSAGGPLAVEARVSGFPGVGNVPTVWSESVIATCRVASRGRCEVSASLGVVWEQLDFHDGQRRPNHLRFELGPAFLVGLGVRF